MRADVPKQYLPLFGRPMIAHALERLCAPARVRGVVVGLAADDTYWQRISFDSEKFLGTFLGGETRAQTVLNGLQILASRAQPNDWVMVHDAARPCLRLEDVERLIDRATQHADGGLLALPVSDTVKRVDASEKIVETVSRTDLWRALTPQLFRFDKLTHALREGLARGLSITDEASAIEADGGRPIVVPGHTDNIKVTLPEDLALAEVILRQQGAA